MCGDAVSGRGEVGGESNDAVRGAGGGDCARGYASMRSFEWFGYVPRALALFLYTEGAGPRAAGRGSRRTASQPCDFCPLAGRPAGCRNINFWAYIMMPLNDHGQ